MTDSDKPEDRGKLRDIPHELRMDMAAWPYPDNIVPYETKAGGRKKFRCKFLTLNMNLVCLAGVIYKNPVMQYRKGRFGKTMIEDQMVGICCLNLKVDNYIDNRTTEGINRFTNYPVVVPCYTFGRQAETCHRVLNKGDIVLVEGSLRRRYLVDKNLDPVYERPRSGMFVRVYMIQFLEYDRQRLREYKQIVDQRKREGVYGQKGGTAGTGRPGTE